tara:strand:- start:33 stop:452 length:420 start_codon:yes stop_codon:yes gene_type:complete
MREIKYRAWVLESSKFIYKPPVPEFTSSWGYRRGEYVLEQYTGLKDKNGTEIYEGDIILLSFDKHWWKFECKRLKGTSLYFIELSNNCATEGYGDEERYTYEECTISKGRRKDIPFTSSEEIEIIGNIHENLELLKCQN